MDYVYVCGTKYTSGCLKSSGVWRLEVWYTDTDILKPYIDFLPRRLSQYFLSERLYLPGYMAPIPKARFH
jgi:hypothetical protein